MNKEKDSDPTAEQAVDHVMKEGRSAEEQKVNLVIRIFKLVLLLAGMEMENRVRLRDKHSGRTWI